MVDQSTTNINGNFSSMLGDIQYELEIMKPGYEPVTYQESEIQAIKPEGYLLASKNLNG